MTSWQRYQESKSDVGIMASRTLGIFPVRNSDRYLGLWSRHSTSLVGCC